MLDQNDDVSYMVTFMNKIVIINQNILSFTLMVTATI